LSSIDREDSNSNVLDVKFGFSRLSAKGMKGQTRACYERGDILTLFPSWSVTSGWKSDA